MSYCVIPGCLTPQNPHQAKFCFSCGSKLLLRERYRSTQPIGRGGFGITFLAVDEDIPSKPRCVVKQLYLHQGSLVLKKAVELFHQEAERLDELGNHSQIPALLAHFEQNKHLYLVQELIEGETLEQELQRVGTFEETQIWQLLRDLLPVLKFVHDRKVIHRDIKPTNIIRRRSDKKPILIDFGVAKLITNTALFHTGTTVGSAEYMAPEQTKGKAFPASDLYSLGVSCIYLLTGVSPFELFDIINNRWAWRNHLPSGKEVSDRLGKILDKLLESTIKNRYQSVEQVLQALNSTQVTNQLPPQLNFNKALVSEVRIDYTRLQNLLTRKKWKEADQQTWEVLCQALGKARGQYLFNSDIEKLPCNDLKTIDKLWVKYSEGHFGFSVQNRIYQEADEDYTSFCDRVGWSLHNSYSQESALKFNLRAPVGHLPSRRWLCGYNWWHHPKILAAKLENCGIAYSS
jgi:serine/threonine protein kinase